MGSVYIVHRFYFIFGEMRVVYKVSTIHIYILTGSSKQAPYNKIEAFSDLGISTVAKDQSSLRVAKIVLGTTDRNELRTSKYSIRNIYACSSSGNLACFLVICHLHFRLEKCRKLNEVRVRASDGCGWAYAVCCFPPTQLYFISLLWHPLLLQHLLLPVFIFIFFSSQLLKTRWVILATKKTPQSEAQKKTSATKTQALLCALFSEFVSVILVGYFCCCFVLF